MERRYARDQWEVVQLHPEHGRRPLIKADGHGQSVWVGEVSGHLLIYDAWHVMGSRDGSLRVLDPDSLESIVSISLDLNAANVVGFLDEELFVLSKSFPGGATWQAWQLGDWRPLPQFAPTNPNRVQPLASRLTYDRDLPQLDAGDSAK